MAVTQFIMTDGFGQVAHRAGLAGLFRMAPLQHRGHDDKANAGSSRVTLQLSRELQPVLSRHDDVQDREIVRHLPLLRLRDAVQSRFGVFCKVVNHPPT